MAGTPKYKVFDPAGNYQGSAKDSILAAVMADWLGYGSTVRIGHAKKETVWTATDHPVDSWDFVGDQIAVAEEVIRDRALIPRLNRNQHRERPCEK